MKKLISFLLVLVLALLPATIAYADDKPAGFGEYEHVFIIGVDGAGAAFEKVDSPNFDRIFADNAYRHDAVTEWNTTSAQNWGAILTGVDYETHGFTNDSTGKEKRSSDSPNGSIFRYVRQAMPDAELISFNNWSNINHGIIEDDLGVRKINRKSDPLVTDAIIDYFQRGHAPTLMFVQLDSCDHAAHSKGGFSDEYYEAVAHMDIFLGEIYDAIYAKGLMKNSLFILVADHGETTNGHGGQTKEESSAVLAAAGHSVNACVLNEDVHNRDVSAIALYALGVEQPAQFISSVPADLFGESREKTVEENPMSAAQRSLRRFLYVFVRMITLLVSIFDK